MPHSKSNSINEVIEAAKAGDLNKIKHLASVGVKVDDLILGKGGFLVAAEYGHIDTVKYFIDNYHLSKRNKEHALLVSARHGKIGVVKLLMEQYGIFYDKAIHGAIENDHLETMKCLLDFDYRYLYAEDIGRRVPLQTAVSRGKLQAVKELLENYKADLHKVSISSRTIWETAIRGENDISMLRLLLQYGSDINQIINDSSQVRAIQYVLDMCTTLEVAEFLASAGADMHVCDALGNTLLHFLLTPKLSVNTADSFMSKIQFLVEYGVNPVAENAHGKQAKSLLAQRSKITAEQFDISVEMGLATIQSNKRIIAVTLEQASIIAQLPQLPSVLQLLIVDCVGGHGKALGTGHLALQLNQLNEKKEDGDKEEADASDSSSNSHDSPQVGNGIKASTSSAKQPFDEQQPPESDQLLTTAELYTRETIAHEESGAALLMKLFSWIKDLPKILQQEIIASSSMQSVLELLDSLAQPYKFIDDQLSGLSLEEIFVSDYNKHYRQDSLYQTYSQDEAHANRHDAVVSLDKTVGTISSYGILIDQLPNYDHNFATPCLLVGMASL